jgi:hypothetical protein
MSDRINQAATDHGHGPAGTIGEYEELLVTAWSCLSQSHKIDDPVLRQSVVDLAYRCQQLAQAAILAQLRERGIEPNKAEPSP